MFVGNCFVGVVGNYLFYVGIVFLLVGEFVKYGVIVMCVVYMVLGGEVWWGSGCVVWGRRSYGRGWWGRYE